MKLKIAIKHYLTGALLFEFEKESNTIKDTLVEAVRRGAYLRGADLRYAYLRDAKNLNSDATDFWWHVHHEVLVEYLTEPVRARINYIKSDKPKHEIETRLRLLKPVLGKIPLTEKGWERLHKKECKGCPWNGTTIFPVKTI